MQGAFFLCFSEKGLDKSRKIGQAALKAFLRRATDEELPEANKKHSALCDPGYGEAPGGFLPLSGERLYPQSKAAI